MCPLTSVWAQLSTNEKPISFGIKSGMTVKRRSAKAVAKMPNIDIAKIETPSYNEKRSFITEKGYTEWKSFTEILNQGGLNIDEGINARDFHISLDEQ